MATSSDAAAAAGAVVRSNREAVRVALVERDREALAGVADPETVVEGLLTPAFFAANTDFPDLETFLEVAGAPSVWALGDWLDWVLDWHVLGNTRFWSWEWLAHAAVEVGAAAAAVGPVACADCGGPVGATTASAVETPGHADEPWVEFRCTECEAIGRATLPRGDGDAALDGLVRTE